jgi:hypothetical protein
LPTKKSAQAIAMSGTVDLKIICSTGMDFAIISEIRGPQKKGCTGENTLKVFWKR